MRRILHCPWMFSSLDHMFFVYVGHLVGKDRRQLGLILHFLDRAPGHEHVASRSRISIDLVGVQDRKMILELRSVGVLNERLTDQVDVIGQPGVVIEA